MYLTYNYPFSLFFTVGKFWIMVLLENLQVLQELNVVNCIHNFGNETNMESDQLVGIQS
jgi:hypothetical protein